jgi:ribosomal protein L7/L12
VKSNLLQAVAAIVVAALAFVVDLPDWLRLVVVGAAVAAAVFAVLGLVVGRPAPALPEGDATVRLEAVGDQPIAVIRELRRRLGLDLAAAKATADAAPTEVATGVAGPDADRVAEALRSAGATVTVSRPQSELESRGELAGE